MDKLVIKGEQTLFGSVQISGAKNSAVALIPATLLSDTPTVLDNVPVIRDVLAYIKIIQDIGVKANWSGNQLTIDPSGVHSLPLPSRKASQLRASYYLMGVMLGRFGEAIVGLPGGCEIGSRPIDQHLKGFRALGAKVTQVDDMIRLVAPRLQGARIYLDEVSVGATINIMLAAVMAEGLTVIENAAKEPEVIDVAILLNSMGADIIGAGTDTIRIKGVHKLHGCYHTVIPDRIEAGTFMIAAAATRGEVLIDQVIPKHIEPLSAKLREMGVAIFEDHESLVVSGRSPYTSVDIKTLPYPGFPTDLQPLFTVLLTQAEGTSLVSEHVHLSRFSHIQPLIKMGAKIRLDGRTAVIDGPTPLVGTKVYAEDIRTAAALLIAGLIAKRETTIIGWEQLERGYEQLLFKLRSLSVEI
ncbi:UDP-N-acetylglucosamine 1-carboxyvinyltransferase [Thermoflavimicrobium dichotomicum]|uniref:UDP-N-acetylglucosamine 1-carboxyvinyltransferase n=1 Tax=Thermoflavimicrobium dichotomicum TaxID=46223 RepID=A0A1I3K4Y7_9BACL|nr:UDP-N-acetylglucosamine 1-carboxyvinyltransferase [Thermoflavimicrobium dichotomicum]SFI67265.1 UDP-N-acetylglucosamine 1-carboxyvinyltransferase [Thermoflavimicrobium dichotomicum]